MAPADALDATTLREIAQDYRRFAASLDARADLLERRSRRSRVANDRRDRLRRALRLMRIAVAAGKAIAFAAGQVADLVGLDAPKILAAYAEDLRSSGIPTRRARDLRVMRLARRGLSDREIATEVNISERQVSRIVARLLREPMLLPAGGVHHDADRGEAREHPNPREFRAGSEEARKVGEVDEAGQTVR